MTSEHWDQVYGTRAEDDVSWFQTEPRTSLELIEALAPAGARVVDVGGGRSRLIDRLLQRGDDVTVVDLSAAALADVALRLGDSARAHLMASDILEWSPDGTYDVWHDRAALHFLTDSGQRERYASLAASAVREGGHVIVASFALDGPTHCSGLEVHRTDAEGLAELFAPQFALVSSRGEDHETPSGAVQRFVWAVLQRQTGN